MIPLFKFPLFLLENKWVSNIINCNTLFTSTVLSDLLLLHLKYHSHLILFCKILQLKQTNELIKKPCNTNMLSFGEPLKENKTLPTSIFRIGFQIVNMSNIHVYYRQWRI